MRERHRTMLRRRMPLQPGFSGRRGGSRRHLEVLFDIVRQGGHRLDRFFSCSGLTSACRTIPAASHRGSAIFSSHVCLLLEGFSIMASRVGRCPPGGSRAGRTKPGLPAPVRRAASLPREAQFPRSPPCGAAPMSRASESSALCTLRSALGRPGRDRAHFQVASKVQPEPRSARSPAPSPRDRACDGGHEQRGGGTRARALGRARREGRQRAWCPSYGSGPDGVRDHYRRPPRPRIAGEKPLRLRPSRAAGAVRCIEAVTGAYPACDAVAARLAPHCRPGRRTGSKGDDMKIASPVHMRTSHAASAMAAARRADSGERRPPS